MFILAVDDDDSVVEVIQGILERDGHACVTAGSVEQADWIFSTVSVDALVLDYGMPGRRPLDWLEDLAKVDPSVARRTVIITGHGLNSEACRRIRSCGAAILQKPFRGEELLAAVQGGAPRPEPRRGPVPQGCRPRPPIAG